MTNSDDLKLNKLLKLPPCPKCGSERIRDSAKRHRNSLFNFFFYESFRCRECRYHFERVMPSRIFLSMSILVVIGVILLLNVLHIPIQPVTENILFTHNTASKVDNAESELEMGLSKKISSPNEAAQWFEKSAKHGNIDASYYYGLALFEGIGIIQNYKEGLFWLDKAATAGHAQAQFFLGDIFHRGIGIAKDDQKSYLWFTLAAAQNESAAIDIRDQIARSLSLEQISYLQEEARKIAANQSRLALQK